MTDSNVYFLYFVRNLHANACSFCQILIIEKGYKKEKQGADLPYLVVLAIAVKYRIRFPRDFRQKNLLQKRKSAFLTYLRPGSAVFTGYSDTLKQVVGKFGATMLVCCTYTLHLASYLQSCTMHGQTLTVRHRSYAQPQ